MQRHLIPPALREGDLVAVVAPAGPFDEERYRRGAAWLATRYRLRVRDDVHHRHGYLAGDDARRREELAAAVADPEVRAIVAARGGYGATRITSSIDWASLARSPKWIVGFSDVTALHVEASRVSVASLHAPMLAWLGDASESDRTAWRSVLETAVFPAWNDLEVVRGGDASGVSFGGNLALLEACAAGGRLHVPEGAILFLEDCTERPYRLDRMLTSLVVGGHLDRVAGVVLGDFTDCTPGPDGVSADEVVRERLESLGVPIVARAPFGHGAINRPFPIGVNVTIVNGAVNFAQK
ncbi:MAG: S66 peptidase family protein [Polyangiales bacterium]